MFSLIFTAILVGSIVDAAPEWRVLSGEFKSYRQMGDQIEAEYEKLHPDGSITRKVASGDVTKGLTYNNYQIDPDGNVRQLDGPGAYTDRLGYTRDGPGYLGQSGYPRDTGVTNWKPEKPRMRDVKMTTNPLKDFFKDIFSW